MRIGRKLVISYSLLTVFIMLVMIFAVRSMILYTYSEALTKQLIIEAESVKTTIDDINNSEFDSPQTRSIVKKLSKSTKSRITLVKDNGIVVADSNADVQTMENHIDTPEIHDALAGKIGKSERHSSELGYNIFYIAVPYKDGESIEGAVRIAIPQSDLNTALSNIYLLMLGVMIVALLSIAFISSVISKSLTTPLRRMKAMTERMSNEDLKQELPVNSKDEIADLSKSLNKLAIQLKGRIEELRSEQTKARLILNNMTEGIILLDGNYKVMLINPAAESIFDIDADKITGVCIKEVIPAYDFTNPLNEALLEDREISDEIDIQTDLLKTIRILILPITDSPDSPDEECALIVVRDNTREKQVERVRKDFVANVSHELKTPLTRLKLLSETLKQTVDEDPRTTKRFIDKLDKELSTIISMVRELIDLSKLESNPDVQQKEWVNLGELVLEVGKSFGELAENRKLKITFEIPSIDTPIKIPLVYGYRNQLQTLARNLIDNAIRYTRPGGNISIQIKHDANTVDLIVKDTGIGLAKREISRIFERFYRVDKARSRETGSTGLGLSIVKHISENHSATINVKSDLGIGSTFTVRFPLQSR